MRERINRLAKGIIDPEMPRMTINPQQLDEQVPVGTSVRGEISITSTNGLNIKGLAYSSHFRVKVLNSAFGGLRNRVAYEIDTEFLESGDEIEGSFFLVTNGGEVEVPFLFHAQFGVSGQALGNLKTARDYANLARRDRETALRLFEYQEFTEAPFMQDIHTRTVYEGLKGHRNRENLLEEFLTDLQVKEPVSLSVTDRDRSYRVPEAVVVDTVEVKKNTWGYVEAEIEAEGNFLELMMRKASEKDFKEDTLQIGYRIHPKLLHRGKNTGCIYIRTLREEIAVKISVEGAEIRDTQEMREKEWKKHLIRYLTCRLDMESGQYETALALNRMKKELDTLRSLKPEDIRTCLLQAECCLLLGQNDQASRILEECRDEVLLDRRDELENYCLFQYLSLQINPNQSQSESLIRLVRKYLSESRRHSYLFFLRMKLEPEMKENPASTLTELSELFMAGMCSPFLYLEACRIYREHPDLFHSMGPFELQAAAFGAERGMLNEALALKIAKLAAFSRHYNGLYSRVLVKLYEEYQTRELLEAICCIRIKGEKRGAEDFKWYEMALEDGINLTRLYEYYLYSLPKDFNHLLPKEVLLYFSYDHTLDRHSRSVLYKNILTFMNPSDELYKTYERDMEQFAMEQLFQSRINSRLAVLYDHMIYKDIIDVPVAKVLPAILRSYRIACRNDRMLYVIVRYEETTEEDAFLLKDGVAYVPLFSEKSVILFQDAYGNRYTNIRYLKTPVMDKPELEERCFEVYPEHPMLCLKACRQIVEKGAENEEQAAILQRALEELSLNPLYRQKILSRVIAYYQKKAAQEETGAADLSYLLMLDKDEMSREERRSVCETLIRQNYLVEAYDMMKKYGFADIGENRLLKLCTKMILQNLFDEEDMLSYLAVCVFDGGKADSVILDYLSEHYNGPSDKMYAILIQASMSHVETYDLAERLLAQMLFSGKTDEIAKQAGKDAGGTVYRIDRVFDLYASKKKISDSIIKAYFTVKCTGYFLEGKETASRVFEYLEGLIHNSQEKGKVPTIYLLSLSKYYSEQKGLEDEQKALCQQIVNVLLEGDLIFPYFKKLGQFIRIPDDIMDKAMIEYRGSRNSRVDLKVRVLPDEEEFHSEEMRRVYQGIFVRQKVLFEGEILEYQIYEYQDGTPVLKAKGQVNCDMTLAKQADSRFSSLNDMGLCISMKEEAGLKKKMQEYLIQNETVEQLFSLI